MSTCTSGASSIASQGTNQFKNKESRQICNRSNSSTDKGFSEGTGETGRAE
jgi:hypothetical protein